MENKYYYDRKQELEPRTLKGCLTGLLIILTITIFFWWGFFELLKAICR